MSVFKHGSVSNQANSETTFCSVANRRSPIIPPLHSGYSAHQSRQVFQIFQPLILIGLGMYNMFIDLVALAKQ